MAAGEDVADVVEALYRSESRRVLATLIRLLGDFERAEEALQEAFAAALSQWSREGVPENPRAWLVSTGRFKAIDRLRRQRRHDQLVAGLPEPAMLADTVEAAADESVEDDRLRLIFTCCHPALDADARVALTLREVCGLTTEEVARAFLARPATIAQRIVRAKRRIRDARIPYEVPARGDIADARDPGALAVVEDHLLAADQARRHHPQQHHGDDDRQRADQSVADQGRPECIPGHE